MIAYLVTLVVAVVALAVVVGWGDVTGPSAWATGVLALVAAVGERARVRLSSNTELSVALVPTLFAAVAVGPLASMIVGGAAMLGDFRRPYLRWAIYTSIGALSGLVAGLVVDYSSSLTEDDLGALLLGTVAGAAAIELLDFLLGLVVVALRRIASMVSTVKMLAPVIPPSILILTAVVAPLALAYERLSPWVLPLFLLPVLAMHRLYAMYQEQRALASDLGDMNVRLERANLSFASALVAALDARDRYTAGHSAAVAVYARDIAAELDLSEELQQLAHLAGLVHDIGKIGVPPGILEKSGPLTLRERRLMEKHSETGEKILAEVEAYSEIARIVRHHHERIDGLGYPDGIDEGRIPLLSRIICVADAYNAMTSDRPYRIAMTPAVARSRLIQAAGSQFDTDVVRAFDRVLERATAEYATASWASYHEEAKEHPALADTSEAKAA